MHVYGDTALHAMHLYAISRTRPALSSSAAPARHTVHVTPSTTQSFCTESAILHFDGARIESRMPKHAFNYSSQCRNGWAMQPVILGRELAPSLVRDPEGDELFVMSATIGYNLLQYVTICYNLLRFVTICYNLLQLLRFVTICYDLLRFVATPDPFIRADFPLSI